MKKKEIWECSECGLPCRVEINFSEEKLPEHLKNDSRFRDRSCPCKETRPTKWEQVIN